MRKRNQRRLGHLYQDEYYKPRGIPLRNLEEEILSFEELETLRLVYIENLSQTEAAQKMGISQSAFQRDIQVALHKISVALIERKALKINRQQK